MTHELISMNQTIKASFKERYPKEECHQYQMVGFFLDCLETLRQEMIFNQRPEESSLNEQTRYIEKRN